MNGFVMVLMFALGAFCMYVVSEHYYKRIERIVKNQRTHCGAHCTRESVEPFDARQADDLQHGKPVATVIKRY